MAATLTSRVTEQHDAVHCVSFPTGRSGSATTERTGSQAGGKVFRSSDLVNAGNDYEPRLSSAVQEIFGLQPRTEFRMGRCGKCGNEFDLRISEQCPECRSPKPVTTCLTCGHDLPVIESQAESDRRYAKALAHDLRARNEVYSASLVERLAGLLSIEPRDVTRDCCDTISDKLSGAIDHNGVSLLVRVAEIEMPVCDDFTAAPLLVRVRKDGFDFEFTLKSALMRSHWRTRDRKFWCLSYSVEMV